MNAAITTNQPQRHAPRALWLVAQAFLNTLYALFGAPENVAARHTLLRDAHERIASWLACGEAFLRRLLLIEAAAYFASVQAEAAQQSPAGTPTIRQRKPMGFDADKPEEWRVSFRCFAATRGCGGPRPLARSVEVKTAAPRSGASRFRSAWPLAERYEAMIRVFNNPEPYARRLAQRLYERPHSVDAVLRAPDEARHRIDRFEEAGDHGVRVWPTPYLSSA